MGATANTNEPHATYTAIETAASPASSDTMPLVPHAPQVLLQSVANSVNKHCGDHSKKHLFSKCTVHEGDRSFLTALGLYAAQCVGRQLGQIFIGCKLDFQRSQKDAGKQHMQRSTSSPRLERLPNVL